MDDAKCPETKTIDNTPMQTVRNNSRDVCIEQFETSQSTVKQSIQKPKALPCIYCNKMFRFPSEVLRHPEAHKDRGSFTCDQCRAFNTRPHNLKKPKRKMHGKETIAFKFPITQSTNSSESSTHTCLECKLSFKTRRDFRDHYNRVRNMQLSSICDRCGKHLSTRELLKLKAVQKDVRNVVSVRKMCKLYGDITRNRS